MVPLHRAQVDAVVSKYRASTMNGGTTTLIGVAVGLSRCRPWPDRIGADLLAQPLSNCADALC